MTGRGDMIKREKQLILSIDDDPDIRALLATMLTAEGLLVHEAASGQEGIEAFDELAPDLVLLDVMMPGMDGFEVCAELQKRAHAEATPVVFLTARGSEQDRQRAFACGAVGHLVKPFDRETLLALVRKHLRTKESWKQIVNEASRWSERIVPDDYVRFRQGLADRFDPGSPDREALLSAGPSAIYAAGDAVGLPAQTIAEEISGALGLAVKPRLDPASVVIDALPVAFCRKNLVVPMLDPGDLRVYVLSNPFNWELLELLEHRAAADGMALSLAVATPETISTLFRYGGMEEGGESQAEFRAEQELEDIAVSPGDVEAAPVVFIANNVLLSAVRDGASDIHLEPKEDHMEIRFRIDGEMHDMLTLKAETAAMLLSRLKALAAMDIAERRKPQDGSWETHIGGKRLKLRLATSSGPYGESMVIRILEVSQKPRRLEELGYTDEQAQLLYGFAERPHGMILIVGPTGSGKTTTIYSTLSKVDTERRSLMTVEDPVEYVIPRANHQQVNDKAGVSFENLLKSSVRQDPDVLFLGEIRDQFSARTALDFASTGHLTVSTLHTSNSTTAVFRLERLGVDRGIMADAILGVVAQRLVKRLCPECKTIEPITAEERAHLAGFTRDIPEMVAHPVGCPKCRGGYKGRTSVAEIFEFDADVGHWLREGVSISEVRQRLADRGDYLVANSVLDKVRAHEVSVEDAWRGVLVEELARPHLSDTPPVSGESSAAPENPAPVRADTPASLRTDVYSSDDADDATLIGEEETQKRRIREGLIGGGPSLRVLVADDDVSTRELVGKSLESDGYEVIYAEDGLEALKVLRKGDVDLVLSDVTMPRMDGMHLVASMAQEGFAAPVILLTGVNDGEMEAKALTMGVADYVSKPVRKDVLLLRVGRVLRDRT